MADSVSMAVAELLRKAQQAGDVDFLRVGVRVLTQALLTQALLEVEAAYCGVEGLLSSHHAGPRTWLIHSRDVAGRLPCLSGRLNG